MTDSEFGHDAPRIGILVVAYNAADTLASTLSRIPKHFGAQLAGILVSDDASRDSTFQIGVDFATSHPELPLTIVRQSVNLGYGGNQKFGYRWAIENEIDVVVLLHGDGQYAPELLPEIVEPITHGRADAVFGSRMMTRGTALRGGMPLYKYIGNRILSRLENTLVGVDLTEWHSGYRAYRVETLRNLPFESNSDGFDFDTQIIVELFEFGACVKEIPIPTYYGDEISHVNGLRYAFDIIRYVLTYRLHRIGFGSGELAFASGDYEEKHDEHSSHAEVLAMIDRSSANVLDLGCGPGYLSERLRANGHRVVGIDAFEHPDVHSRTDGFVRADLSCGLPSGLGEFDVVLAADILEHLPEPEQILVGLHPHLAHDGEVITSFPNFSHWYPRLRMLSGRFDYDRRGILDQGHLRFFTIRSFTRIAQRAGYTVQAIRAVGLPLEVSKRSAGGDDTRPKPSALARCLGTADRWLVRIAPSLFAYQYVVALRPTSGSSPTTRPGTADSAT